MESGFKNNTKQTPKAERPFHLAGKVCQNKKDFNCFQKLQIVNRQYSNVQRQPGWGKLCMHYLIVAVTRLVD